MAEHKTKPDLNLFFIEWCRWTTRSRPVPTTSVWKIPAQQRQRGGNRYTKHNHTHTHTLHDIHSLSLFCLVLVPFHRPASIATTPTTTLPTNQPTNQPNNMRRGLREMAAASAKGTAVTLGSIAAAVAVEKSAHRALYRYFPHLYVGVEHVYGLEPRRTEAFVMPANGGASLQQHHHHRHHQPHVFTPIPELLVRDFRHEDLSSCALTA